MLAVLLSSRSNFEENRASCCGFFHSEKYFIYVHAREQKGGREKVWKRMDEMYIYIGSGEAKNLLEAWIPIRRIHRLYPGTQFTRGSARDILTDFNRHYCY